MDIPMPKFTRSNEQGIIISLAKIDWREIRYMYTYFIRLKEKAGQ